MDFVFATQAPGAASPFSNWIIMLCMFAGMWFLMIAPQRKRQKQQRAMLDALKKGDRVLTASGIYGVISEVQDACLTLEVARGVHIEVARPYVQAKV